MHFIKHLSGIVLLVVLAPLPLRAQQGGAGVTVTGQVSAVVAVSATSDARVMKGEGQVSAAGHGLHALVVTLSGLRDGETQVEIPVRLRSNADFTLAVSCAAGGARPAALSVVEVAGAGALVHPGAAARVEVAPGFDARPGAGARAGARPDLSSPVTLLSGPPVSKGGTLSSPGNMLEVLLRVVFRTPPGEKARHAELKLSAAPRGGL